MDRCTPVSAGLAHVTTIVRTPVTAAVIVNGTDGTFTLCSLAVDEAPKPNKFSAVTLKKYGASLAALKET